MGFAHQFSGSTGWTDHSDRAKNVTRNFTAYVSEDTNGEWTGYVRGDAGEFFAHGKTAWSVLDALSEWVQSHTLPKVAP